MTKGQRRSPLKQQSRSLLILLGITTLALVLALSPLRFLLWGQLRWPIPIRDVQTVGLLRDRQVTVEGQVSDRVPLIGAQVYQVQDATGKLWVVSSDTELKPGEPVKIRGNVRFETLGFEGKEQGEIYLDAQKKQPGK
ncbi:MULTISPECIES: hypothetical protein [unclassified Leptolyngbya]|uniref:hypothetical protein n=1 Tax=unclassified Leptolyngbya TaxID=2650499 RepID=UPI0016880C5F|nr:MULTISPECIES: hypothetical protein [unclassified Leptolyngbya]MBD1910575.1 hypothetical protein [Leptolyngbya sp. FACHB-8]MBD2153946.1 hypothetical protein [Leptolyngbya sp. FACHB-16]